MRKARSVKQYDDRCYSEEERLRYWKRIFPSGSFFCVHCDGIYNLVDHRERQKKEDKPSNQCRCGALLVFEAFDSEGAAARRGAQGGSP